MNEIVLRTILTYSPLAGEQSFHIKRTWNPITRKPYLWLALRSYWSVDVEWDYLVQITKDEAKELANKTINNEFIQCDELVLQYINGED